MQFQLISSVFVLIKKTMFFAFCCFVLRRLDVSGCKGFEVLFARRIWYKGKGQKVKSKEFMVSQKLMMVLLKSGARSLWYAQHIYGGQ